MEKYPGKVITMCGDSDICVASYDLIISTFSTKIDSKYFSQRTHAYIKCISIFQL